MRLYVRFKPPQLLTEHLVTGTGRFCHCDVVVAHGDRQMLSHAAYMGRTFGAYKIPQNELNHSVENTWEWIPIGAVLNSTQIARVEMILARQHGASYNWGVFLSCGLRVNIAGMPASSLFCSQAVIRLLQEAHLAGPRVSALNANTCSPSRLFAALRADVDASIDSNNQISTASL